MPNKKKINYTPCPIVGSWLLICAGLVLIMATIGAITRLTDSGLSMVEWRPLIGMIPPLSELEWQRVFGLYQQTPEYHQFNMGMNIEAFKEIFFWEWFHRFFGHLIGIVFVVPLIWYLIIRKFNRAMRIKLWFVLLLGFLQALMGWYMVQSGLADVASVSHYRLAVHLLLALLIFSSLLWFGLDNLKPHTRIPDTGYKLMSLGLILATLTILFGAFVAGKDAGLIYNSFPMMGEDFIPSEILALSPWWLNIFENHSTIQFIHRWLAVVTAIYLIALGIYHFHMSRLYVFLIIMSFVQVGLGIATLLSQVHIILAALHQAGAFILVGTIIFILQQIKEERKWSKIGPMKIPGSRIL